MEVDLSFFASPLAHQEAVEASEAWVRGEIGDLVAGGMTRLAAAGVPCRAAGGVAGRAGREAARVPLAVVLTGGTEDKILAWLGDQTCPALLLALPHSNSLPAAMEVLARLGQLGRAGRIIVAGRGDWRGDLAAAFGQAALAAFLRTARIGLLGGPSSWLAASSPDPTVVRRAWGPEVVTLPLSDVAARYRAGDARGGAGDARGGTVAAGGEAGDPGGETADLLRRAAGLVEPGEATLDGAGRLYRILRDIVEANRLDALTVRCFDLLGDIGNTGCLALSRLNDEGLVAACEGDLPATLTMMVLSGLTGRACFMANPSDLDVKAGTATFAHCSVPLSLVRSFRLRSHFESGLGAAIEGHFAPGVMTVARIGGENLSRFTVFTGTVVPEESAPFREDLCRTQVTLKVGEAMVRELLRRPLGNHHVLVPGDHVRAFLDFGSLPRPDEARSGE